MTKPPFYKRLLQYFLQGLLVTAPVAITAWAIMAAFNFIDGMLPGMLQSLIPGVLDDGHGQPRHLPGLGFVVIILLILFIGYISSSFLFGKVEDAFDRLLQKTPVVKFIYTTLKDFFEAFAGDKKKFTKAVLANIDDNDVWRVGFITQEDMQDFGLTDYVSVYIPMAYSVAGNVYIIPKTRVRQITNIGAGEAMKFAVSGGVTSIDE